MASEFRVEKSQSGFRVALYRDGEYYVTFVDGLTQVAAKREAQSLTVFWQRIRPCQPSRDARKLKPAS